MRYYVILRHRKGRLPELVETSVQSGVPVMFDSYQEAGQHIVNMPKEENKWQHLIVELED